ncbi:shikimate dehydrogenase [Francisella sp. 19X1-34]|uniref:shikimate dehydrogenase family protein n=1 Tax=Francisella sp. 19X1-34 TaxID=3087177 RepID=UPI002E3350B6|nr:shikimate dehydrogenase [Francisella sp. 19X1-34]MED7787922.1 shikimate dehydrogenase [Francisella sp. 19X1-34]
MSDLYHVIGYPVKHSLSPKIQMELAKQYDQDMIFTAVEVNPEDLDKKIAEFKKNPQIKGLSVTVPHKERVFELSDDSDNTAKAVGAASNVIFTPKREMIALNYDGLGIVNDIKNNYKVELENKKILVAGAGGAAKAVVAALIKESPSSLTITNRTKQKAQVIADLFRSAFAIEIEDFSNITGSYDVVINSTSSSIYKEMLPLKITNFSKDAFAYDLMYADGGTVFTNWCQDNSIRAADGKGMLQELSKAVFKYWRKL